MGKALRVTLPFEAAEFAPVDNPALSARTNALSLVTIGLAYYVIDDFENALDYFSQAEATQGWLETAGKEVIYLLLGNATVRKASEENSTEYLDTAAAYFEQAMSINPTYNRAMVGQAGVLYLQGIGDPIGEPLEAIDLDKLDEAEAHYRPALDLGNPPPSANIEAKVHFGLGQVNVGRLVHAVAAGGDWQTPLAEARVEFLEVVQEYDDGNLRIANLAGHAHRRLGLLAWMQGQTEEAVEQYRQAIELVTPFYQAYAYSRIGDIYADAGQKEAAIEAYEEAIRVAEFYGNQ
jgi:tetratricopeptide (TPR) repeat protein